MSDLYHINIEGITLDDFQQRLESSEPLPGRKILKQDVAARFSMFKSHGMKNMQELWDTLKTKKRLEEFAQLTNLPLDYLTILRREIGSYLPKPVNLNTFPGIDEKLIKKMAQHGIKQSKQLLEHAQDQTARDELAKELVIADDVLLEIVRLAEFIRIPGVGPVFARMLFDAGCDSLDTFCQSVTDALFTKLMAINEGDKYTRSKFTTQHVRDCQLIGNMLPRMISY